MSAADISYAIGYALGLLMHVSIDATSCAPHGFSVEPLSERLPAAARDTRGRACIVLTQGLQGYRWRKR